MTQPNDWQDEANLANTRDPRRFPYGYQSGGSFVLDSARVFLWFDSISNLVRFLLEVQPRVFDIHPGEGLEQYQAVLKPFLERTQQEGLSSDILAKVNDAIKDHAILDWWGTFDDILSGRQPFGRDILDSFLPEEREGGSIMPEEMDEFVEYLSTYGC